MKEEDIKKAFKEVDHLLALQKSKEALDIIHKIQDNIGEDNKWYLGKSYFWESLSYKHLGDYKSAEKVSDKGISIFESLGDFVEVSKMQRDLGLSYEYVGKLDKALKSLKTSINTLKEKDVIDALGITFSKIGQIYLKKKEIDNALYYCDLGYRICSEGRNSFFVLTSLLPLSLVYYRLGDVDTSQLYLKNARNVLKKVTTINKFQNERRLSEIILREALCFSKLNKRDKVLKAFKDFSKISLTTPVSERAFFTQSDELAELIIYLIESGFRDEIVDFLAIELGLDIETLQEEIGVRLKN